jgi:hypothetical protein
MTTTQAQPARISDAERDALTIVGRCRTLVAAAQRDDIAPALEVRRRGRPAVAVIGETKRGKSALVNALIGRAGLSPVAPDVATCVPVTFEYSDTEWCRVWLEDQEEPLPITLAELHAYASELENPGNLKRVRAAEAGLPSPVLADLDVTLIDTPGVGGLVSGHARLTLQALGTADAIIFVLDVDGEIGLAEYQFLRQASQRIDTVIFALTKCDLVPDWERVAEENGVLLAENLPALDNAKFVPFSSLLAEHGWPMPPGPQRTEIFQRAGLIALFETLRLEVSRRAGVLQTANTLRACISALDEIEHALDDQLIVAEADPVKLAELGRRQQELTDLQYQQASWRTHLLNRLSAIQSEQVSGTLAQRLAELKRTYEDLAGTKKTIAEFNQLVTRCSNEVKLAVAEILEEVEVQMHQAVATALGDIQHGVDVTGLLAVGAAAASLPEREWRRETKKTLLEHYRTVWPAMGVHSLLVAAIGGAVAGPFGLLAVVPFAAVAVWSNNALTRRSQFLAWLVPYLTSAQNAAMQASNAMIRGVKDQSVDRELHEVIKRRLEEITSAKKGLEQSLHNDKGARAAATAEARRKVDELAALRREARSLIGRLQSAAGPAPAGAPGT